MANNLIAMKVCTLQSCSAYEKQLFSYVVEQEKHLSSSMSTSQTCQLFSKPVSNLMATTQNLSSWNIYVWRNWVTKFCAWNTLGTKQNHNLKTLELKRFRCRFGIKFPKRVHVWKLAIRFHWHVVRISFKILSLICFLFVLILLNHFYSVSWDV